VQVSRRFTVVARPTHLLTENGSALQEAEGADHRVRRTTYELKAVVLHQGATLHAGHYVTVFQGKRQGNVAHENDDDILELGGQLPQQIQKDELAQPANEEVWYCANDTEVTEITPPHLQRATDNSKACYLAIYEAKGSVFEWDAAPHSPDSDDNAMRSWIIQFPPMQDDPPPPPPPAPPTVKPPPVPKMTDVEPSTPLTMELPETLLEDDDNYDYDYDDDERAPTEPSTPITTVVPSALPLGAHCTSNHCTSNHCTSNHDETIVATCPPAEDGDTPPHERCSSEDEVWLLSPTK
ncbi:ubiquitin hydrolase, putative, partial [Bodo saltans]